LASEPRTIAAVARFFSCGMLCLYLGYQDVTNEWSLYHARISFSMNIKMISPQEVIASAIQEWEKRPNEIEYNQLEGFVRQIIDGEYMREFIG
jgi:deoxyribodipyrimidine photolyase-related protein